MRRMIQRIASCLLAALLLTTSTALAADPIRIGYLGPLTGIFAQAGKDMLEGLKMGLEGAGGQVAGVELEAQVRVEAGERADFHRGRGADADVHGNGGK